MPRKTLCVPGRRRAVFAVCQFDGEGLFHAAGLLGFFRALRRPAWLLANISYLAEIPNVILLDTTPIETKGRMRALRVLRRIRKLNRPPFRHVSLAFAFEWRFMRNAWVGRGLHIGVLPKNPDPGVFGKTPSTAFDSVLMSGLCRRQLSFARAYRVKKISIQTLIAMTRPVARYNNEIGRSAFSW